jgi:ubiquinone biosynthesis protein
MLPAVLVSRDFGAVVDSLFALGAATGPVDRDAAARDLDELITPLVGRALGDIAFGEVLDQIIRVATRHRVRLPRELVLVVKQLLYFERYGKAIAPDHQILSDPELLALLARAH